MTKACVGVHTLQVRRPSLAHMATAVEAPRMTKPVPVPCGDVGVDEAFVKGVLMELGQLYPPQSCVMKMSSGKLVETEIFYLMPDEGKDHKYLLRLKGDLISDMYELLPSFIKAMPPNSDIDIYVVEGTPTATHYDYDCEKDMVAPPRESE